MKGHQRILAIGRLGTLALATMVLAGGCGGSDEKTATNDTVARGQESSRAAWEKAKAEGTDKPSARPKVAPR